MLLNTTHFVAVHSIPKLETMSSSDDEVETFESADGGAAETFPLEAGQIKKGGYMNIKV